MKAKSSLLVGILILTSLLFIAGCHNSPRYSSEVDTVKTLETPNVRGKAYPGVNYVYWDKVANAQNGYRLDIYENGILVSNESKIFSENITFFYDTNIQNDVEKTYSVSAIGDSQARSLYFTESKKGSVSLKGIVPPSDTNALDLVKYENGYDPTKTYELNEKEIVLSEDNIEIIKNEENGNFSVLFPAKPYLKYTIYAEQGNAYEYWGTHSAAIATYENIAIPNNTIVTVDTNVSISGEYSIYVKVAAINKKYVLTNEIKARDSVSYDTIDLSTSYSASVINELTVFTSPTSAVIYWTPAKLLDGSYVPANYYKVYKAAVGSNKYVELTNPVTEYSSVTTSNTIYSIVDEGDFTNSYVYRFVITDGTKFAKIYTEYVSNIYTPSISTLDSDISAIYKDKNTIELTWTPNILANGSEAPISAYTVYRRIAGNDDSTYEKIAASITSTTEFNKTTYSVEDSITNNEVTYIYMISLDNGTETLQKTIEITAYKETYVDGKTKLKVSYIKDDTARILWIPDVINGETLAISDYSLYRKDFYKADSEYVPVNETIRSAKTQENETVYYFDSVISDTTVAYSYLITYKSNNKIYKSTAKLDAYTKAVVLATPVITVYADDVDGIENDIKIEVKVSEEQTLETVKYIELSKKDTTSLLDADYPNSLETADATSITENGTTTYTWLLKDITEGIYISVVAIVDENASYATTSNVTASEPALTTSTTGSKITIELLDNDNDGLDDDAFVIITLADNDKILSSVTYASADSNEAAIQAAANGTELTYSKGYGVYAFSITDAVSNTNPFFAISAVISEEGKKDAVITKDAAYTKATASISVSDIIVDDLDDDGLLNDIYFATKAEPEQTISIVYAIANTAANAEILLESEEAEILVTDLSGYKFYEFSPEKYEALHNLPLGKFIAIAVTATDENATNNESVIKKSTVVTKDNYADLRTEQPIFTISKIAADEDGLENDIYLTIEIYKTQILEELIYATSTEDIQDLESFRLDSIKTIDITNLVSEKYSTSDKVIFEKILKDFEVGTCFAARATVGEAGKISNSVTKTTSAITENIVTLSKTADIYSDQFELYFTSYDADSNYNDIRRDTINVTLGINQSIKSIRWVTDVSIDAAQELLRTDSTIANNVSIPRTYQLNTSVLNGVSTLTKTYSIAIPSIKNIPEGNIVLASIIISEPGYLDNEFFIATEKYDYSITSPVNETFQVPEYSWKRPVQDPMFEASDSKNYEYVHVQISDYFLNDSINAYTYKLERTYENKYNNSDEIWEVINNNLSFTQDWNSGLYNFDKWYKDIPVGEYVYRITKTRKSTGEKSVIDRAVSVVYNVEAPAIEFQTFESENLVLTATEYMNPNYDYLNKYEYKISYIVSYINNDGTIGYSSNPITLRGWSWEPVLNAYNEQTGYYTLANAVITEINNNSYPSVVVTPTITKTRKLNREYYDSNSTNLNLFWGLTASIAPNQDISITNCYESTTGDGTYIIIQADEGYDSYTWFLDSNLLYVDPNSNTITIYKDDLTYGSHDILVVAVKDGISYSTSISYTK